MSTYSNDDASNAVNNGSSHITYGDNSDSPSNTINNNSCGAPNRDNNHGEEFHVKCLHQMCRICSKLITRNTRYYNVNKYAKDLAEAYGVNFNADKSELHPPRFCFTCYGGVLNFRKRGRVPTRNVGNWKPHSHKCSTCEIHGVKGKGGRPAKIKNTGVGRPKNVVDIRDIMKLDGHSPIPASLKKAASHILALTAKKSPNQLLEIKTCGPNPLIFAPVTVGRKDSRVVSRRTLRARTQQITKITSLVAGGSREGIVAQTAHVVKGFGASEREEIVKLFKSTVSVPPDVVASMKSVLGLPWNMLRDIRRWLKTFSVSLAPEGQVRSVVKDWVGTGLYSEELPATFIKDNKVTFKLTPWCYIFNLVGYVIHYLDCLKENNLLVDSFIPSDEIFLKVGGDHGGGSFKMSFQVANVENPNKPENTVVFSVLEAKDYKSNLLLCLERFKTHIAKFSQVKWSERTFQVYLFGDYEFLCTMYGISGASGRHPCLWCHITKDKLQVPLSERDGIFTCRSLESLKNDYHTFMDVYNSNLSKAKLVNNVINDVFFDIPLEKICIPGLHITLGVYIKLLRELEHFAKQLDVKIAEVFAVEKHVVGSEELAEFVGNLNVVIDGEKRLQELTERREILLQELSWFAVIQDDMFDEDYHRELLSAVDVELSYLTSRVDEAKDLTKELNSGPCFTSIDSTLNRIGVERAKYFGGTIVGNDCHKLLKPHNIAILCDSLVSVLNQNITNEELSISTIERLEQFKLMFSKYADCHNVFNSARYLSPAEVVELEVNIIGFMAYLRCNFPEISITPKLHMLEDHMIPFIRRWGAGCGFFGEQGGESIHSKFNNLKRNYANIKNKSDCLKSIMQSHLSNTNPYARAKRVVKKKRNLKRNRIVHNEE